VSWGESEQNSIFIYKYRLFSREQERLFNNCNTVALCGNSNATWTKTNHKNGTNRQKGCTPQLDALDTGLEKFYLKNVYISRQCTGFPIR
jgi:hypothetical protein